MVSQDHEYNPYAVDLSGIPPAVIDDTWLHGLDARDDASHEAPSPEAHEAHASLGKLAIEHAGLPAAKPKGNLYLAIGSSARDEAGTIYPDAAQRQEIITALSGFDGISGAPDEATVKAAIHRGKQRVEEGSAASFLKGLSFIADTHFPQEGKRIRLLMEGDIALDPRVIVGAQDFASWLGRAYGKMKTEEGDRTGRSRPSFEVIEDYASRDTQLPAADALDLYLTDAGIFAKASNAHRTAAAQLRDEPLRVRELTLIDYRGAQLAEPAQAYMEHALIAAAHNQQVH